MHVQMFNSLHHSPPSVDYILAWPQASERQQTMVDVWRKWKPTGESNKGVILSPTLPLVPGFSQGYSPPRGTKLLFGSLSSEAWEHWALFRPRGHNSNLLMPISQASLSPMHPLTLSLLRRQSVLQVISVNPFSTPPVFQPRHWYKSETLF